MYATTRQFLDYFNLKSLEELPPLAEIKDLENLSGDLALEVLDAEVTESEAGSAVAAANSEIGDDAIVNNGLADEISESAPLDDQAQEGPAPISQIHGDRSSKEGPSAGPDGASEMEEATRSDASEGEGSAEKMSAVEETSEQPVPEQPAGTIKVSSESFSDGELLDEQSPAPAK